MELIEKIILSNDKIDRQITILRILLICVDFKLQNEGNLSLDFIEKKKKEMMEEAKKYLTRNEICPQAINSNLNTTYNQITNDFESINNMLNDLKEEIYPSFKAANMAIIESKNNADLEKFYNLFKEILTKYETMDSACDYLFYHSGLEISVFIKKLLKYIDDFADERCKKLLPINFFNEYQEIVTLSFKEWVGIFNNTKFTIKYINPINKSRLQDILISFNQIEVYYFILMYKGEKFNA